MGVRPAAAMPQIDPAEMAHMVARAGLVLNPGQMADLFLAWRQIVQLAALIPHNRPLADDMALTFRLPPPAALARRPAGKAKRPPARRQTTAARGR